MSLSKMKSFPLFELPEVSIRYVAQLLTLMQCFNLSLCSPKAHFIIRDLIRQYFSKNLVIRLLIEPNWRRVEVNRKDFKDGLSWTSYSPRHKEAANVVDLIDLNMEGHIRRVSYDNKRAYTSVSAHFEEEFIHWARYFIDLFQCPVENYNLSIRFGNDLQMLLDSGVARETQHLSVGRNRVDEKEMLSILSNFEPNSLSLYCTPPLGFKTSLPFKSSIVNISASDWITVDNVKSMMENCKKVVLDESRLTDVDLNEILKAWLDGKGRNLEKLQIKRGFRGLVGGTTSPVDSDVVHGDLNVLMPPTARPYAHPYFMHKSFGRKIRDIRRSDGALGVITTSNILESHNHFMKFYVFYDV